MSLCDLVNTVWTPETLGKLYAHGWSFSGSFEIIIITQHIVSSLSFNFSNKTKSYILLSHMHNEKSVHLKKQGKHSM